MYKIIPYLLLLVLSTYGCGPQGSSDGGQSIQILLGILIIVVLVFLITRFTKREKQPKINSKEGNISTGMDIKKALGILLLVAGIGVSIYFGINYAEASDNANIRVRDPIERRVKHHWEKERDKNLILLIFGASVGITGAVLLLWRKKQL